MTTLSKRERTLKAFAEAIKSDEDIPLKIKKIASRFLNLANDNRPYLRSKCSTLNDLGLLDSGAVCAFMGKEMYEYTHNNISDICQTFGCEFTTESFTIVRNTIVCVMFENWFEIV